MKSLSSLFLLLSICFSAIAIDTTPAVATSVLPASSWIERLSNSLKMLNFSTSFVVVKNNQAEPYHWFHGLDENNTELEILSRLNGPRRDVLRKNMIVSYIEPEVAPYSIESENISGPIPSVFSGDILSLGLTYEFISVGRSRVLGRVAQLIRIVSKDKHRYGYWLWLDQESGLLLKLALITQKGQLLEQVQFTHLEITTQPAESLMQLKTVEFPLVIELPSEHEISQLSWTADWVPVGFKQVKSNRHRIAATKQAVEFMLYSDGLVDVSVYVSASEDKKRAVEYVMDGATVVLNQVVNGFEISVVGKIPFETAKAIADTVNLKKANVL